jgi:hypothetical protein
VAHLEIDFPVRPFDSAWRTMVEATRLFGSALPFLILVTLVVAIPAKLAVQLFCAALDLPPEGIASYVLSDLGDLVWSALVVPATIYGLMFQLRKGRTASLGQAFGWGRRQWGKMLWTKFKVEITVTLWSLLLIVPGIVVMIRLLLTDPIVAIEADRENEVLRRSRTLTEGRRWRIFFAVLPAVPLSLVHLYVAFRTLQVSRYAMVLGDGLFSIFDQWMTVAVLLIYLGIMCPAKARA